MKGSVGELVSLPIAEVVKDGAEPKRKREGFAKPYLVESVATLMSTFRVQISSVGLQSDPVELLSKLMRELHGAGGIISVAFSSPDGNLPTDFTYLFLNDDYETCGDFRKRLQGLIERKVCCPIELSVERKNDASGLWIID